MVTKLLRHLRETLTLTHEVRELNSGQLKALAAAQEALGEQMKAAQASILTETHAALRHEAASLADLLRSELDVTSAIDTLRDQQNATAEVVGRLDETVRAAAREAVQGAMQEDIRQIASEVRLLRKLLDQILARQLRDASRQVAIGSRPIRVRFFFQSPETWTSWESVWHACTVHEEVAPMLVLLPFNHDSETNEDKARNFLADQGLPFIDQSAYDLESDAPDIVFLQNPYDSTRPANMRVSNILASGVHIAYIPYGLEVGGGADGLRWQYDLDVQRHAWRIFARSEHHRRMYGRLCLSGNQHVIVTGHPKIDNIVANHPRPDKNLEDTEEGGKVVLWTPHFSVEPGGWSTFGLYGEAIFSFFESGDHGLRLLIRPHPLFFGRLRQQTDGKMMDEAEFRRRVAECPFIELDEDPQYLLSFSRSAALMADAGSFLLEYLLTEKPILYLHNQEGPGLSQAADFVESYAQARSIEDLKLFLDAVAHGKDEGRQERLSQIPRVLYRTDGKVGETIVAHLVDEFKKDMYIFHKYSRGE